MNETSIVGTLSPAEQSQLAQTIEMFEIIVQNQPQDFQSLEILKEAYFKLERKDDLVRTARRIAQAYVQSGQLSSAILEYESILQHHPEDPEVLRALAELESSAATLQTGPQEVLEPDRLDLAAAAGLGVPVQTDRPGTDEVDDGQQTMYKLFVESRIISPEEFEACWPRAWEAPPGSVVDPFIQVLGERGTLLTEKSLKLLCEKSRLAYLPIEKYDIDFELARRFPADTCRRWCVLPFDSMSKSVLVATSNPYNRQAAKELETATSARLLWYLAPPQEIVPRPQEVLPLIRHVPGKDIWRTHRRRSGGGRPADHRPGHRTG